MTASTRDSIDDRLLNDWQRGLPIVSQPFAEIAQDLAVGEGLVLERIAALQSSGLIARVGGVVRPNTIGASTLAALSVPDLEIDAAAAVLSAEPGVNHVYLRENDWNIWFVVTGPDRQAVEDVLARVAKKTGRRCLDLRLERPYYIDLGFSLNDAQVSRHASARENRCAPSFKAMPGDRELVQALMTGLPIVSRPFQEMALGLNRLEADILTRINELIAVGVLPRVGVIVRHRALGWRSNAMVVWDVDEQEIDRAGAALARVPGINLCYRRTRYPDDWPYNLYCMVHAKTRKAAFETLTQASEIAGLGGRPRKILFSLRCFKQTGALVARMEDAA